MVHGKRRIIFKLFNQLNLPCGAKDYFVYDIVWYECILNALEIIVSFKDVRVTNKYKDK